tara:strand:- start:590 stop:955 length:366 start_codon:yes stop_codon:yes gene_type:complete
MAHFAKVNDKGIVTQVIVAEQDYIDSLKYDGGDWIQTSYNTHAGEHLLGGTPLRKNFAGVGMTYDKDRDAFITIKEFDSWTLNETTCQYDPPIARPTDGKLYKWNEAAYQADNNTGWEEVS